MNRITALFLAVAFAAVSPRVFASHSGLVKWESGDAGFARAKAENKKIMLYFSASW
jgi:hypothetical protein